jgi:ribosomal protein S18 acetylase RimI-like enzyme
MASIVKVNDKDIQMLADIGRISFVESHGNSASEADINEYVKKNYTYEAIKEEIRDPKNIYHIIYRDELPAGYSKIIYNVPYANIPVENVTKLDRIYLLKEFYGLKLGYELFTFNVELSKKNGQAGMWLFVWKENHRAVNFYEKTGFKIIGSHDFKLSETHSNPNHQMLLIY